LNVISNASPIIALSSIGRLDLLRSLDERILTPTAVVAEVQAGGLVLPPWIEPKEPSATALAAVRGASLGSGERAAVALALDLGDATIILDDRAGREAASAHGIPFFGTLAVLLAAKKTGHIAAVMPLIDQLKLTGFWTSEALIRQVRQLAGE
jgi:predicted nucleic acid-binding protein